MGTGGFIVLLAALSSCTYAFNEQRKEIQLDTPRGQLIGWRVDLGSNSSEFIHGSADIFLGIPYVRPPVKERRLRKPEALCTYTTDGSPLRAQEYKDACYQRGTCASANMSEDCLYLNVFSPDIHSTYKYPVMLYIHGGALMRGCAQEYHYRGAIANLVSRGVVVVTIQYRLGLLGFFTTGTDEFPANLGMLDQVEAIKWVSDQIQHFGGDPYRITLWGQSAGAASTSAHTYSPISQDLFAQAIMESGVALTTFEGSLGEDNLSLRRAVEVCNFSLDMWVAGNFTGLRECLDSKKPEDWTEWDRTNIIGWKMQPDNDFFPDIPHRLAPMRRQIPILMGSNHDEWTYYDQMLMALGITWESLYTKDLFEFELLILGGYLEDRREDMQNILENVHAGVDAKKNDHLLWMKAISASFTGGAFTSFIIRDYQEYLANNHSNVYLYEMTYGTAIGRQFELPGWPDAVFHTAEVNYIWKRETQWDDAISKGLVKQSDYDLAEWFGKTWTDFAKYGKPKGDDSWAPIPLTGKSRYLNIDGPTPSMAVDYRPVDNLVWNQVLPGLVGDFFPPQKKHNSTFGIDDFNRIKSSTRSTC